MLFKKGQRVIVVKYVDKSIIGQVGTVIKDTFPGNFDEVELENGKVMYFWNTEIKLIHKC